MQRRRGTAPKSIIPGTTASVTCLTVTMIVAVTARLHPTATRPAVVAPAAPAVRHRARTAQLNLITWVQTMAVRVMMISGDASIAGKSAGDTVRQQCT